METAPSPGELEAWIRGLPDAEKTELLLRLVEGGGHYLGVELRRRFQHAKRPQAEPAGDDPAGRRTAAELRRAAAQRAETRRRLEAAQRAAERARRDREAAAARAKYRDELAGREEDTWRQVAALIETKRPADYDRAVQLLKDLRDLSARSGQTDAFAARLRPLRDRHAKKVTFLERLDRVGLGAQPAGGR